jgi:hypothetical protein
MKNLLRIAIALTALTLVALSANAQTPASATPVADEPDLGSVSGNIYTNKYFGLTLTFPAGWSVQDDAVKKQISDKGKEIVTSDDPVKRAELERAVNKVLNLFTVSERVIGSPGPLNSVLICGAEPPPSGVKTAADYMLALKHTLKFSRVPVTLQRDVYTELVGGAAFSVIEFKTDFSGVFLNQKYYAQIRKDYVLFFIVTYDTPEQLKTLDEMLRSVVLK